MPPSQLVREVDPVVERAVLSCLAAGQAVGVWLALDRSAFGLLLVGAIAIYGLLVSLAGRPLLGSAMLEK